MSIATHRLGGQDYIIIRDIPHVYANEFGWRPAPHLLLASLKGYEISDKERIWGMRFNAMQEIHIRKESGNVYKLKSDYGSRCYGCSFGGGTDPRHCLTAPPCSSLTREYGKNIEVNYIWVQDYNRTELYKKQLKGDFI